jgi:hypothetical protein
MQLQRQLKGLLKGSFEFCNTRNRTRVVTKEMTDLSAILPYFTFCPKSQKHFTVSAPAEDILYGLVDLGFDIISVKQMYTTCRSPAEGTTTVNNPLFLITLPRMSKSHEIFKLTSLCHIAIKVEVYKAQTGLVQCYYCQKFCHVSAKWKQPHHYMWCGGSHLHEVCPEKGSTASIPTCCTCKWWMQRNLIPPTIEAGGTPRKRC